MCIFKPFKSYSLVDIFITCSCTRYIFFFLVMVTVAVGGGGGGGTVTSLVGWTSYSWTGSTLNLPHKAIVLYCCSCWPSNFQFLVTWSVIYRCQVKAKRNFSWLANYGRMSLYLSRTEPLTSSLSAPRW